jgi:hypothetical protein
VVQLFMVGMVNGSTFVYWRWGQYDDIAKNGMMPFVINKFPQNKQKGRRHSDDQKFQLIAAKLQVILQRKYIAPGFVSSLTDSFDVPKDDVIRLVYNGSCCGLNAAIWVPNFWLPFSRSAIRVLDFGYYSVDMDIGEMFLNFPLH